MLIFIDTETTGLPKKRQDAEIEAHVWPDIVSIAWIVTDDAGTVIRSCYFIVKPKDWIITEDSTRIHKIQHNTASDYGIPLEKVAELLITELVNTSCIVAHNMNFDRNVIVNALKWKLSLNVDTLFNKTFCTMEAGKTITNLPKNRYPSLSVLYTHLFGSAPNVLLHNALNDALVCMKVYFKINSLPVERPVHVVNEISSIQPKKLSLCLADITE
ncbi:3'-5' exonuclease [bacterium]|nr:3'-5' exonuclease [Actinomycetota bacterium]NDG29379.1 3'-5' exonuclease [bacterium]